MWGSLDYYVESPDMEIRWKKCFAGRVGVEVALRMADVCQPLT